MSSHKFTYNALTLIQIQPKFKFKIDLSIK